MNWEESMIYGRRLPIVGEQEIMLWNIIFVWDPREASLSLYGSKEIFRGFSWTDSGIAKVEIHEPQTQVSDEIQQHEPTHQANGIGG